VSETTEKTSIGERVHEIIASVFTQEAKVITLSAWQRAFGYEITRADPSHPVLRRLIMFREQVDKFERKALNELQLLQMAPTLKELGVLVDVSLNQPHANWGDVRKNLSASSLVTLSIVSQLMVKDEVKLRTVELKELQALIDMCEELLESTIGIGPSLKQLLKRHFRIVRRCLEECEIMGIDAWKDGYKFGWFIIDEERELREELGVTLRKEENANLAAGLLSLWKRYADFAQKYSDPASVPFTAFGYYEGVKLLTGSV